MGFNSAFKGLTGNSRNTATSNNAGSKGSPLVGPRSNPAGARNLGFRGFPPSSRKKLQCRACLVLHSANCPNATQFAVGAPTKQIYGAESWRS